MQVTTPKTIEIGEARATIRNPVALWILTFLSLGILAIFWWYGVSREIRDISGARGRPRGGPPIVMAILVALWPLAWIPAMIAIYLGTRSLRGLQEDIGVSKPARPIVAALLFPLLFVTVIYAQRAANETWGAADPARGAV